MTVVRLELFKVIFDFSIRYDTLLQSSCDIPESERPGRSGWSFIYGHNYNGHSGLTAFWVK